MAAGNKEHTMNITVIPTATPVTHYAFSGETLTAFCKGEQEDFDLSLLVASAEFQSVVVDTLDTASSQIIREAYRDESGELHVTLFQGVGSGHWEASDVLDSANYDPEKIYVTYNKSKPHGGYACATTSTGKTYVYFDKASGGYLVIDQNGNGSVL